MKIKLVNYSEDFLDKSWEWLTDPEIKKMTNTPTFSRSEQLKWFHSLSLKTDYKIWGIDFNDIHIGVCGLKNITNTDCEYWGYIGEKKYWGKGIGSMVINELIDYARNNNIKSLWLTVIQENERAIKLYSKLGFMPEPSDFNHLIKMRLIL